MSWPLWCFCEVLSVLLFWLCLLWLLAAETIGALWNEPELLMEAVLYLLPAIIS